MASMLYGLAGKLAGELCSPLFKDYVGKPWEVGTKAEFEKLKNTVSAIESVLIDAEEKQRTNNQVRDWLIKMKLVFYDLEDLLQEFRTEALKRRVMAKHKRAKKVHIFFSSSNQLKHRFKMGRKVKLIRERLDAIAPDCNTFNFIERREEIHVVKSRRREETHSFVPIDQFIGRDADKECVTNLLVQSDFIANVSVISIVGIGGMGKTSLAQYVYGSEEVKRKFDVRMLVSVSDSFDVRLICENIIASITQKTCERLPMEAVKEKVKNIIDGRKFLLVLDDVWNESSFEWMNLELLLTGGARGSKILITARAELVARAAKSTATHVLKGLSPDDSWALFKQVTFKRGAEQVSPTIVGIGKEVAEICDGVPLVVKVTGSMLALKEKEIEWLDFKKNDLPRVTQDSEGKVLQSLKLSYDYLSAPLKRCFVFCALFPKNYLIEREKLIGMWMAHGLIQLDGTPRSLEDVGEQHLKSLLDRSFFEVHQLALEDEILSYVAPSVTRYKMHDLIHDLAESVGGAEYYKPGSGANCIDKWTLHALVFGEEVANLCHEQKLRTLILDNLCDEHKVNEVTRNFEQLLDLGLACLNLTRVPSFVGGSRHLYYLDLSLNMFETLPEAICSLYNLQMLILTNCFNLKELPKGTKHLVSLRCLEINGCDELRHLPRGLEELTCLQTLSTFVTGKAEGNCAEVCELKSLVNLRGSLTIANLRGSNFAKCNNRGRTCPLSELKLIQQLFLHWEYRRLKEEEEEAELLLFESLKPHPNLEKLIVEGYECKKFPSWMDKVNIGVSLPNIVYICLHLCKNVRHLPPLGLLPSLQVLHLRNMPVIEYLFDVSSTLEEPVRHFPLLKELSLCVMPKLTTLVEPKAESHNTTTTNIRYFPILEKLKISDCPLLSANESNEDVKHFHSVREVCLSGDIETVPVWLQYLPYLESLKLTGIYGMVSLPEWIGNLTSLQELHLENLGSLASFPECMKRLTSLQRLIVEGCPELVSRCEMETRADWHKIAHIPSISVKKWRGTEWCQSCYG